MTSTYASVLEDAIDDNFLGIEQYDLVNRTDPANMDSILPRVERFTMRQGFMAMPLISFMLVIIIIVALLIVIAIITDSIKGIAGMVKFK